jgi:hypothetical protein
MLENVVKDYLTKSKGTNGFNNINLRGEMKFNLEKMVLKQTY